MKTPDHSNSQTVHEASPAIEVLIPTVGADESTVHAATVRVHIDRQVHKSPADTTHEALYRLGGVPHDHVLFKEERGNREDSPVPRGDERIRLSLDDHFYSVELHERGFAIIVNGRPKTVNRPRLTFPQVVALAFDPVPTGPNWVFTITYRNGPRANPEGTLLPEDTVRLKKGMVFNVTATDKS
ncbi:MAG: multiubiquitin domain-containing protein [Phycisphaerales bacterium]